MNMCFACGSVVAARRVFDERQARDVVAWTGMVSGYVDSRMYLKAIEVFQEMRVADDLVWPNVASVVSVASACAGLGSLEYAEGLHAYVEKVGMEEELIVRNTFMDGDDFRAGFTWSSHAGLVDEGINIFSSMESKYSVSPDIKHYGCMVDLFIRAGLISRAYEFISTMPFEPNLAILGALLSACSINNELEIGN
ncbi:putative pentatricopeptide repeat-containing protein At5g59200, chloroplastic [Phragmites australis]|uniref:putative pentatricopeptide repeat-containing protein At5g59200, chloroplastic n=1 Tax=Phragmites australis TaxID=29695 RepID=UPI002D783A5D|nr:putative pentatricopeptide repeat-containing protein At5g59200, chloroplastic [Phragmites australis]